MQPPSVRPSESLSASLPTVSDRRSEPRLSAEMLGFDENAKLSLGVHVRVVNLSSGGALLELDGWIRPGTRSELRLSRPVLDGEPERLSAHGQVARCWVYRLSPLRYRAALVFEGQAAVTHALALHPEEDLTVFFERAG